MFGGFRKQNSEEEVLQDKGQENIQVEAEEEETVVGQNEKTKYYYMVVDKDKNVILDKQGDPFFCTVEEGSSPEWPSGWPSDIISMARIDKELRVELHDVPANLTKDDKKKAKRQIKEDAREQLLIIGAERIAAAKDMKKSVNNTRNNTDKLIDSKLQEVPKVSSEEKADIVKPEVTSVSTKIGVELPSDVEKKVTETEESPKATAGDKGKIVFADLFEATLCVEENVKRLSEDLKNDVDDLIQTISSSGVENIKDIKSYVEVQSKHICDTSVRVASNAAKDISQKTQKYVENVVSRVNETSRGISETQDKLLSKVNTVGKRVTELGESVEGIEGNLHRLDQLDEIAELLRDKGVTMSRDIPAVNADEEDIINLVRYSQKITEQLGYAARDFIRKQAAFKSQEESNANEQRVMEQRISKAHEEGVEEGKKIFIKQLLSKYEDVDSIRESDISHVHAIWTLLTELGVTIDGEGYFEKGKEIELTDADIEKKMGTYSKLEDSGKYRVTKTGLCFQGEILCKAIFEKIVETAEAEVPEAEMFEEAGKEEGAQETASEEMK